jgi:hypothetical protein
MNTAPVTTSKNDNVSFLVLLAIIIYGSLHLLEEGLMGFPAWAQENWGIPDYTLARWLTHNFFFLGCQLVCLLIYLRNRHPAWPLGIIFWGVLNTLNHSVFWIITSAYTPGFFTGLVFLVFLWLMIRELRRSRLMTARLTVQALLVGIGLWVVPAILFVSFDLALNRIYS